MTGLIDGSILPIKEDVLGRKVIPSAVNNCHNTAYNDSGGDGVNSSNSNNIRTTSSSGLVPLGIQ